MKNINTTKTNERKNDAKQIKNTRHSSGLGVNA